jgi:ribose 5-phosphate isomerase B
MNLIVGSDERTAMTDAAVNWLEEQGHQLQLIGPLVDLPKTWPDVARTVAESVAQGDADEGILFCWTGTGVSIAANKVPGIRAALCVDAETARGSRRWNDANVLCLSLRLTSEQMAKEILESWFNAMYEPNPEDDACLMQVAELDRTYRRPPEPASR